MRASSLVPWVGLALLLTAACADGPFSGGSRDREAERRETLSTMAEILGALPYQRNEAVLHTDERLLPASPKARAAWNYVVPRDPQDTVSVTYDMNVLQGLDAPVTFCVTLNPSQEIDPGKVIERMTYDHPIFTAEGIAAQARRDEIDGQRHTHFCGAYWGNGFHEDGVQSALAVCRRFGAEL